MTGIYKIENLINRKVYIGQSIDINRRIQDHKFLLNTNKHHSEHLQRAYNKYGKENFKFEIIEECDEEKLTEREQYWIDFYGGYNSQNNYNNKEAGMKGRLSEEGKQKISEANKGNIAWNKGITYSNEYKQKLSKAHKNYKPTEEIKQKISETMKMQYKNKERQIIKYWLGKHHSQETLEKMKQASKNRIPPSRKGMKFTDEQRKHLSEAHKGKTHTKEQIEKISRDGKGRIWINNGVKSTKIKPNELDKYLQLGYIKGRIFIKKKGK